METGFTREEEEEEKNCVQKHVEKRNETNKRKKRTKKLDHVRHFFSLIKFKVGGSR